MARIIAAPAETRVTDDETSLFLAGGITNCIDWQDEICEQLRNIDRLVILNPRRENYTDDAAGQILWEWQHLRTANAISFWFSAETVQPITLFELGRWTADIASPIGNSADEPGKSSRGRKQIFVGAHERYSRRLDVEIQLRFQCPDLEIVGSISALASQSKSWMADRRQ
jgi:hypothetical protein